MPGNKALPKRGDPPIKNPYAAILLARVPVLIAPSVAKYFRAQGKKAGMTLDFYVTHVLSEIMHDEKNK